MDLGDELGPAVHVQLVEDVKQMRPNRARLDFEMTGDLLGRITLKKVRQHACLAARQVPRAADHAQPFGRRGAIGSADDRDEPGPRGIVLVTKPDDVERPCPSIRRCAIDDEFVGGGSETESNGIDRPRQRDTSDRPRMALYGDESGRQQRLRCTVEVQQPTIAIGDEDRSVETVEQTVESAETYGTRFEKTVDLRAATNVRRKHPEKRTVLRVELPCRIVAHEQSCSDG